VLLWGYLPTVISVGLMPVFLLGIERLVRAAKGGSLVGRPRDLILVCAAGIAVSWLHPWQGEVLLVTVIAAVALGRERRRQARMVLIPTLALVAPLIYYFLLSHTDAAWRFAAQQNARDGRLAAWAIAVALIPLVLPALAGLRARSWGDFPERMLVMWPVAVMAVYLFLSPSFPQHAFQGLSLPLAILAVRGLSTVQHRLAWGAILVAILVVPGTVHAARLMRDTVNAGVQPFYLQPGEDRALSYLSKLGEHGAVLSTPYLGSLVPARTGRHTWVGHPSWTRDFSARVVAADTLFDGRLSQARARALVRASRTKFILDDCGRHRAALPALKPIVTSVRRFGCASVYRVASTP
jgi:hypothetical protein